MSMWLRFGVYCRVGRQDVDLIRGVPQRRSRASDPGTDLKAIRKRNFVWYLL